MNDAPHLLDVFDEVVTSLDIIDQELALKLHSIREPIRKLVDNYVPGTVNLDPDGVNAYGSLAAPPDALCPSTRVVAFIVYARSAEYGDVPLTCYAGSKGEITTRVMNGARREGFKGTFQERMYELGWYLVPLTPAQTSSSASAPKWSPTPPTKDGWYWVKDGKNSSGRGQIVFVDSSRNSVFSAGFGGSDEMITYPNCIWHGPLQEPTE